jgi:hypothetical protein
MKEVRKIIYILFTVFAALLGYTCNSNNNSVAGRPDVPNLSTDTAKINFREYEHDFGKVTEGEKVACIFSFENTGNGPLVISSVTTTCGCTVPKYETKPIEPGSTGMIEVVFNSSGYSGRQTKTITVRSNASKSIVLLKITGEIITSTN